MYKSISIFIDLVFLSTSVALNILSLCQLFRDFENILHVSIWGLPILMIHLFPTICSRYDPESV